MRSIFYLFLIVYLLNLIPAFAPPTWMVFSYMGFTSPDHISVLFAVVGAAAATLGRVTLAKLSHFVIRKRFMGDASRNNIDAIRSRIEKRPNLTASIILFYAFTPFPSNYLFIAYGLTAMRLSLIAFPFFVGRAFSYYFWGRFSAALGRWMGVDTSRSLPYLGAYFVFSQILLLLLVYLFMRVDWHILLHERKIRWHKPAPTPAPD